MSNISEPTIILSESAKDNAAAKLHRQLKRRLFSGGGWALGGRVGGMALGLLIQMALARLLAPEAMGIYFLAASFAGFIGLFNQLGTGLGVVRETTSALTNEAPGNIRPLFQIYLLAVLAVSSVVLLLLSVDEIGNALSRSFGAPSLAALLPWIGVWGGALALQTLISGVHRGFHDIPKATWYAGLFSNLLLSALLLIVYGYTAAIELSVVVAVTIISVIISVIVGAASFYWRTRQFNSAKDVGTVLSLRSAFPFWFNELLSFSMTQADLWVVGIFCSPTELAIYGAVTRLTQFVTLPVILVEAVVPSMMVEMHVKKSLEPLEKLLRQSTTLVTLPALLLVLVFATAGQPLLGWVYGGAYSEGALILFLLGLGKLMIVATGPCGYALLMTGHARDVFRVNFYGGLITVPIAIWAGYAWGGLGVAVVVSTSYSLRALAALWLTHKRLGIWTHVYLPRLAWIVST